MQPNTLTIYCDGASRGNPGPASAAFVALDTKGNTISKEGQYLGTATNNVAEYRAILLAHTWIFNHTSDLAKYAAIDFILDSELAVKQLNGIYKVKSPLLAPLVSQVLSLKNKVKTPITFRHVKRAHNKEADALANEVLDEARVK